MFDKSQLMRGTLEGCILGIIAENAGTSYGYQVASALQEYGFSKVKEGTIYPLLLRLERKKFIIAEYKPSTVGPMRKYYTIMEDGEKCLEEFKQSWLEVSANVNKIIFKGE